MASTTTRRRSGRRAVEPQHWWRRFFVAVLIGCLAAVAATGWFDRSEETSLDLGSPQQLLLINDAGPVRVRSVDPEIDQPGVTLVRFDSWLLSRPTIETEVDSSGSAVVRLTCPTRFPCRSSAELVVPVGIELVVVSTHGLLEVSRFDGSVTLYASGSGAVLGPMSGSVRVVSDGPVQGFDLTVSEMNVLVSGGAVDLTFARSPGALTVDAGVEPVDLVVPNQRFNIEVSSPDPATVVDVRTSATANRVIVVRAEGPVTVVNP